MIEEIYKYDSSKYDDEGFHEETGELLIESIKEWETEFHRKNSPYFANHLFSNRMFMIILNNCHDEDLNEDFGFELINNEINMEESFKIEDYSKYTTIYAIGSEIPENKDEPIAMIIDENINDGVVILKHIPDNDEGEDGVHTHVVNMKSSLY